MIPQNQEFLRASRTRGPEFRLPRFFWTTVLVVQVVFYAINYPFFLAYLWHGPVSILHAALIDACGIGVWAVVWLLYLGQQRTTLSIWQKFWAWVLIAIAVFFTLAIFRVQFWPWHL